MRLARYDTPFPWSSGLDFQTTCSVLGVVCTLNHVLDELLSDHRFQQSVDPAFSFVSKFRMMTICDTDRFAQMRQIVPTEVWESCAEW